MKSVTLNDLERRSGAYFALFHQIYYLYTVVRTHNRFRALNLFFILIKRRLL